MKVLVKHYAGNRPWDMRAFILGCTTCEAAALLAKTEVPHV